jgi:hypothetical protein
MLSWTDRQAAAGLPKWEALEDRLAARTSELMQNIAPPDVRQEKGLQ